MAKEKLTKAEIIENIHAQINDGSELFETVGAKSIHQVIDLFFEQIKDGLADGRIIELRGFGTFEVRSRKGKERARNPKTGETVSVEDHAVAVFRPGRELQQAVWGMKGGKD